MPPQSYADILSHLRQVYAALPHHNYGWWLTTREHPDVATIVTALEFLYTRFGTTLIDLSDSDYNQLQRAIGRRVPSQGARQVINRHLLLNMWRPWCFLRRLNASRINPFTITPNGMQIAQGATPPRDIMESVLRQLRFVHTDWTRPDVATQYRGISLSPFQVLSAILAQTSNYISRDEYRLFIARLRSDDAQTIQIAVDSILGYRQLSPQQSSHLRNLEPPLFPNQKSYFNWVDMDLHTFSLFGAGRSFRRVDTILVSTGSPSIAGALNTFLLPAGATGVVPPTSVPRRHRQRSVTLRTPEPDTHLDTPPSPDVQVSNWQEAEDFVAQLLSANSFEVRDFSRLRGYGFDFWARHTTTSVVYYVEVKSSSARLTTIELTRLEQEAAQQYRDKYLLFCVENWDAARIQGDVYVVQDPWFAIRALQSPRTSTVFVANRSQWIPHSAPFSDTI